MLGPGLLGLRGPNKSSKPHRVPACFPALRAGVGIVKTLWLSRERSLECQKSIHTPKFIYTGWIEKLKLFTVPALHPPKTQMTGCTTMMTLISNFPKTSPCLGLRPKLQTKRLVITPSDATVTSQHAGFLLVSTIVTRSWERCCCSLFEDASYIW
jgi:hypothetical protein